MILWWGKKKQPDPKTGETPVEPLRPGEKPASPLDKPVASLDQQLFGNAPIAAEPDLGDDPLGIRKAAERIAAERAAEAAARDASVLRQLSEGLKRSSSRLAEGLAGLSKRKIDRESLDELEELLITSDMGAKVAARITKAFSKDRFDREVSGEEIKAALATEIAAILRPREQVVDFSEGPRPRIVLFVGVNGSGKTTTIGKIASKLSAQGASVLLAAGDTFRAAAVEQLRVWADRAGAKFLSKPQNADAAGLAYEAVEMAKKENLDLVFIDTAGRLQNKTQLMDELSKVVRAIRKIDPTAPHDVLLVLDATVGQNALGQVEAFRNTAGVTGLVMTKLDGTAKGGVLVAIAEQHAIPIHFVGVGEKAEDLHPFSADTFARALVGLDD
jgi:fused signal recognition particle receptor